MHTNITLVINWHLTEACNYRCRYCYAKWDETSSPRDLIRSPAQTGALLHELYRFFEPGNPANPLSLRMPWQKVRLNLAGGEPLLYHSRLPQVVQHARGIGFDLSLITNANRLTEDTVAELAPHLTWLGISIDSLDAETNRKIGRVDRRGHLLNVEALAVSLHEARRKHPRLKLKLNTVVNNLNEADDFGPMIALFSPDKWKVLRVLPVVTEALAVSDEAFSAFVARHRRFAAFLCAEDNHQMYESYLMVDPYGRFFQNRGQENPQGYIYSRPILAAGAAAAFGDIAFDPGRFCTRYPGAMDGGYD